MLYKKMKIGCDYMYIMIDWLIDWLCCFTSHSRIFHSYWVSHLMWRGRSVCSLIRRTYNPNVYNRHLRQASGMLMTYPNLISWAFILKLYVACRSLQDFITFQNAFLDSKKVARYLHIHMMRNQELYIIFVS